MSCRPAVHYRHDCCGGMQERFLLSAIIMPRIRIDFSSESNKLGGAQVLASN